MLRLSWVALEEGVPELSLDDFTCKLKFEMSKMAHGRGRRQAGQERANNLRRTAAGKGEEDPRGYVCNLSN